MPELDAWEISATPPAACLGSRDHEASRSQSAPLALVGLERQPRQASSPRAVGSCRQTALVPQTVFVLVFKLCPFLRTRVFKMDQPTPFFTDKKQAQPENGRAQAVWHGPDPGCLAFLHLETESWTLLATVAISCTEDGTSRVRQACLLFQSLWLKGGKQSGAPLVTWPCSLGDGRKNGHPEVCFGDTGQSAFLLT